MQWSNKAILYNNCYANLVPLLAHVILFFMRCSITIRRSHTCKTLLKDITKQTSNDKWSYNHIVCIIYLSAQLTGRRLPELLLAKRNIGWDSEKWKGVSSRISNQKPIEQGHCSLAGEWTTLIWTNLCLHVYLCTFNFVYSDWRYCILIVIVDSISQALLAAEVQKHENNAWQKAP